MTKETFTNAQLKNLKDRNSEKVSQSQFYSYREDPVVSQKTHLNGFSLAPAPRRKKKFFYSKTAMFTTKKYPFDRSAMLQ
jgi:hypothetical protein